MIKLGYTLNERGLILAANSIVAIIGQLLFGYLCDRCRRIKAFFIIAYLLLLFSSIAMFAVQNNIFYYHIFTIAMMGGMVKVIMGLDETWMLELDRDNYGKLRAAGALGLTIGSPIAGIMIRYYDFYSLIYGMCAISLFLFVFLFKVDDAKKKCDERIDFSSLKELITNKMYCVLVLIFLLVYMIGTADQYVVIDKMVNIGASHEQVGIKWALQSFMEVPLFLGATYILKKFNPFTLLKFGTFMYGIKFIAYGISWNGWLIILSASLQIVTLPIIMLSSKVLINKITSPKTKSSAQMFAMAIFIGVSGLITPLITSALSENLGYDMTLFIVAGFSVVPFILILVYERKYKQKDIKNT